MPSYRYHRELVNTTKYFDQLMLAEESDSDDEETVNFETVVPLEIKAIAKHGTVAPEATSEGVLSNALVHASSVSQTELECTNIEISVPVTFLQSETEYTLQLYFQHISNHVKQFNVTLYLIKHPTVIKVVRKFRLSADQTNCLVFNMQRTKAKKKAQQQLHRRGISSQVQEYLSVRWDTKFRKAVLPTIRFQPHSSRFYNMVEHTLMDGDFDFEPVEVDAVPTIPIDAVARPLWVACTDG
jgi:hypothetical protein